MRISSLSFYSFLRSEVWFQHIYFVSLFVRVWLGLHLHSASIEWMNNGNEFPFRKISMTEMDLSVLFSRFCRTDEQQIHKISMIKLCIEHRPVETLFVCQYSGAAVCKHAIRVQIDNSNSIWFVPNKLVFRHADFVDFIHLYTGKWSKYRVIGNEIDMKVNGKLPVSCN